MHNSEKHRFIVSRKCWVQASFVCINPK